MEATPDGPVPIGIFGFRVKNTTASFGAIKVN
jgi:hypothetical protein